MLSDGATHEAVHLLCRMLVFDPVSWLSELTLMEWKQLFKIIWISTLVSNPSPACLYVQAKRISGSDALSHPYLDEGRLRYHTCMCQCCYSVPSGRVYTRDFEPVAERPFSHSYENSLLSVWQGKGTTPAAILRETTVMWPVSVILSVTDVPLCPHTRVNPSLHHGAPAGKTCAAVHQPSECCLQDLHQVRNNEVFCFRL